MSDAPRPTIVGIIDGAPVSGGTAAPARELQAAVAAAFEEEPDLDPFEDLQPPPAPPVPAGADPEVIRDCALQEEHDTGNGYRLRKHFGRELLNVREVGWHTYDGLVWVREGGDDAVLKYAQAISALIHAEADQLEMYPFEVKILDAAKPLRERERSELTDAEREQLDEADRTKKQLGRRRAAPEVRHAIGQRQPDLGHDPAGLTAQNGRPETTRRRSYVVQLPDRDAAVPRGRGRRSRGRGLAGVDA